MAKEYELVIDYYAFMVAIALARHEITLSNSNVQWTAEELAQALNKLDYSLTPDLRVHTLALKHGIGLFKTILSKRGHAVTLIQYVEKGPSEYFTLSASMRSFEVPFGTLNSPSLTESQDSVTSRVLIIRNELMSKCKYGTSPNYAAYRSACTVYAALYSPLITEIEKPVTVSNVKKTPLITRKSPS
jgi:hypothetical protein